MKQYYQAPGAVVNGDVTIGHEASIWYNAVVRGEMAPVHIGAGTNIQDGCVLHVDTGCPLTIGERCTVGHGVILHGCTLGDRVLVGMGAIVLNNAEIGEDSLIGAGALVLEGQKIPPRSLVVGSPAKVIRQVSDDHIQDIGVGTDHYIHEAARSLPAVSFD